MCQSCLVRNMLKGCQKRFGKPANRKPLLLAPHVRTDIYSLSNRTSYGYVLFLSILLCGHFGLHCLGELVDPDDPALRSHRKVIKRPTFSFSLIGASYVLPFHKADRYFLGNTVVIPWRNNNLDPIPVLCDYITACDLRFPNSIALFIQHDGTVPLCSWFVSRLQRLFPHDGFLGHSIRAGEATESASQGTPEHIIKRMGRWSGDAWKHYIQVHPTLMASVFDSRSCNARSNHLAPTTSQNRSR